MSQYEWSETGVRAVLRHSSHSVWILHSDIFSVISNLCPEFHFGCPDGEPNYANTAQPTIGPWSYVLPAPNPLWRYTEISQFLTEHEDRLKEEGLIRNEGDQVGIAEALLDVLATTCYEGVRADSSGDVGRTFHPERVIEKAKRRQFDGDG